jgi:hypothetical protein
MLVKPQQAVPRCNATVVLLSKLQRPYLFSVEVKGLPPHDHIRTYNIRAPDDNAAAYKGIDLFVREFTSAQPVREMEQLAPKAKLI